MCQSNEKLAKAIDIANKLTDRIYEAVQLRFNCEKVIFEDILTRQIPKSHAANAYSGLQISLVKQLAALTISMWDHPKKERITFPALIKLMTPEVKNLAYEKQLTKCLSNSLQAPGFSNNSEFYENSAKTMCKPMKGNYSAALQKINIISKSPLIINLRYWRNQSLSHNLSSQYQVKGKLDDTNIKWGDALSLLDGSIDCHRHAQSGLNNTFFDWHEISKKCEEDAEELWHNCTFDIPG